MRLTRPAASAPRSCSSFASTQPVSSAGRRRKLPPKPPARGFGQSGGDSMTGGKQHARPAARRNPAHAAGTAGFLGLCSENGWEAMEHRR